MCSLCQGNYDLTDYGICRECYQRVVAESRPLTVEQRADFALGNLRLSSSEATEEMVLAAAAKTA